MKCALAGFLGRWGYVMTFAALLAGLGSSPCAHAVGGFSLFGAGVLPKTVDIGDSGSGDTRITGKLGFGAGFLAETWIARRLGIEAGAAYLDRKYGRTVGGVDSGTTASSDSILMPAGLRWHAGRHLSLELGGFYDHSLESGGSDNYGVQGGLRISLPLGHANSLFAEGRYDLGLKDFGGTKESDVLFALVGITFGFLR
jgi:hypothetical protein